MSEEQASAFEQVTRQQVTDLARRHEELQERLNGNLERIWAVLDRIRDRPSWWAAAVLAAMAGLIGGMATYILSHLNP